ncbi:MAG: aminotransferase class I/II-fold pyridoxal phosphate-dependent enzyme [Gemmatimonadetes bacterium]|nr:aminotransferase class I/II-fold pyridoxal phosphate-dependent enzyme [Gemmatimonadota bacterium]
MTEGIRAWVERARSAEVDATIGVLAGTPAELEEAHGRAPASGAADAGLEDARRVADGPDGRDGPPSGRAGIFYLSSVKAAFPGLEPPEIFPYTPVTGTRAFREAWRAWLLRKAGQVGDPERVRRLTSLPIATPGVSGALFTCGHLLLDPREEIVVADKHWDGYDTTFGVVLGARLTPHRLFTPGGRLDLQGFEDRLRDVAGRQRKMTAIVNFPNNPTGYMPSHEEVGELRDRVCSLLERTGKPLVLLFDDAYEGFVYDPGAYPVSAFYAFVGLHPLCHPLKCDGITKELLFWGGRLGALTLGFRGEEETSRARAEREWETKCSAPLRAIVSSPTTPVQGLVTRLLGDGLDDALAERQRMIGLLGRRCRRLQALLDDPEAREAFRADPFNGGFFAFLNLRHGSAQEVALRALREHRVGVVPMEDPALGINALRLTFGSVPEGQMEQLVRALVASARG